MRIRLIVELDASDGLRSQSAVTLEHERNVDPEGITWAQAITGAAADMCTAAVAQARALREGGGRVQGNGAGFTLGGKGTADAV